MKKFTKITLFVAIILFVLSNMIETIGINPDIFGDSATYVVSSALTVFAVISLVLIGFYESIIWINEYKNQKFPCRNGCMVHMEDRDELESNDEINNWTCPHCGKIYNKHHTIDWSIQPTAAMRKAAEIEAAEKKALKELEAQNTVKCKNFNSFPDKGDKDVVYRDQNTGKTYIWDDKAQGYKDKLKAA